MIRNKKEGGRCFETASPIEIYIHIPFCVRKCAYCDFLSGPQDENTIEKYVASLLDEIRAHASNKKLAAEYNVVTVFLGGGTPSILNISQMKRIFDAIKNTFAVTEDAETTIEANPGTVTREKLQVYRACGINRISFGLQSTNNEELKLLGRIHTYEEFLESYQLARECEFDNINVDLISAIPKQTLASWEETLQNVIALNPEHISAYSLIVEEGTPFAKVYGEGCPGEKDLPDEEEERKIYYRTEELLKEAGYHRYEISNYAKEGKECKHNRGYWDRKEYLGIGLGAASLIDHTRYKNTDDLAYYMEHAGKLTTIQEDIQVLSTKEQMEEFMFLGLRKIEGISEKEFVETFGTGIDEIYEIQLEKLLKEGLLQRTDGRIMLTERGIDVSNYVFATFLD
ncbi:MAG: oxygen-independent coproporphyrinogen III oxidase [Tyzzerella sp.]|nr:oxygen-independent coproporphyrinogen III oxidase [Tyzzerella sp.]